VTNVLADSCLTKRTTAEHKKTKQKTGKKEENMKNHNHKHKSNGSGKIEL